MIEQYICGGLVILFSIILIGIGIYTICKAEARGLIIVLFGVMFVFPGIIIITDKDVPTKQDVFNGKAYYQETIHITNNDTIKTYEIVWKQKN